MQCQGTHKLLHTVRNKEVKNNAKWKALGTEYMYPIINGA